MGIEVDEQDRPKIDSHGENPNGSQQKCFVTLDALTVIVTNNSVK